MRRDSPTPPPDLLPLDREFEGYVIREYVTEGGWARLYRAERITSEKWFAFKTIRPYYSHDPEYRRLFKREQEILDSLDPPHQNICIALDWSRDDSDPLWLAVPWVDGRTLRALVGDGPLEPDRAARLIGEAADGLHSVHTAPKGRGLVHSDLHPGNLMVDGNDRTRVIDFGLAKRFEHSSGSPFLPRKGSWNSPEALRGEELDPRADIYSLGLLLAFALTGAEPEQGSLSLPPNFALPARLRQVIERATDPDRGERYESAAEMAAALREWSRSAPRSAAAEAPDGGSGRRTVPRRSVFFAAALVAVVTFLLVALVPGGEDSGGGLRVGTAEASMVLPEGWSPVPVAGADRKLGMFDAARGPGAVVLLGSMRRSQLPATAPGDSAYEVSLPAGRALRVDDPQLARASRMYALRVGADIVVLACRPLAGAGAVDRACATAAAGLQLRHAPGAIRYPGPGLRREAKRALKRYATGRQQGATQIGAAETAAAAGLDAEAIAGAAAAAAKAAGSKQLRPLRGALRAAARAWRRAAVAAGREDAAAYAAAGKAVRRAERRIRRARRHLVVFGYRP